MLVKFFCSYLVICRRGLLGGCPSLCSFQIYLAEAMVYTCRVLEELNLKVGEEEHLPKCLILMLDLSLHMVAV